MIFYLVLAGVILGYVGTAFILIGQGRLLRKIEGRLYDLGMSMREQREQAPLPAYVKQWMNIRVVTSQGQHGIVTDVRSVRLQWDDPHDTIWATVLVDETGLLSNYDVDTLMTETSALDVSLP